MHTMPPRRLGKVSARKLVAITILLMVIYNFAWISPVHAPISGSLAIVRPDLIAPGGAIELDASALESTVGTVHLYLSRNSASEITDGDIYFTSMEDTDLDESVTVYAPLDVAEGEYYVKVAIRIRIGSECVASDEKLKVPKEFPAVTIDPVHGVVGDTPMIRGADAGDYETFEFHWNYFRAQPAYGPQGLVEGGFAVEDEEEPASPPFEIPNGYEGTNKLIVLFTNGAGSTLSVGVDFTLNPEISVDRVSIESGTIEDQIITITGTGFPSGTIIEDSIKLVVKDFATGSAIETYETEHDEVDIDDDVGVEGILEDLVVQVTSTVKFGFVTVEILVSGKKRVFDWKLLASEPTSIEDFTSIKYTKANKNEGQIGDEVEFLFINLPSHSEIDIIFGDDIKQLTVISSMADRNGASRVIFKLAGLPGGTFSVEATAQAYAVKKTAKIVVFRILPTLVIWNLDEHKVAEGRVGDQIKLRGIGFPQEATIKAVTFSGREIDFEDIDVDDYGIFTIVEGENGAPLTIPHISGGGKTVPVTVEGRDIERTEISAQTRLTIKPKLISEDINTEWDTGALTTTGWIGFDDATIFPGNPLKLVGFGFLAGESVTVQLFDSNDKLIGDADITDGPTAAPNGDLELVCSVPVVSKLYPAGKKDIYLKVQGASNGNAAKLKELDIAAASDKRAKLFFGLTAKGELKTSRKVGDTIKVVGCGFSSRSLKLLIKETNREVKSLTSRYGYFETSITLPDMQGEKDGRAYTLTEKVTGVNAMFYIKPKIVATPTRGYPGDSFAVNGTGFRDGSDIAVMWVGVVEEVELDKVSGEDVKDGRFSIEVEIPPAIAQSYRIEARVGEEGGWASASFMVLSLFELKTNETLKKILETLNGLDLGSLNASISALKAEIKALKTELSNATDQASAARAAADAARAAADLAEDTAVALKLSADAAWTAASEAKMAADAAQIASIEAGTAADDTKTVVDGVIGLIYAVTGTSLVTALVVVFSVIRLQRKAWGR